MHLDVHKSYPEGRPEWADVAIRWLCANNLAVWLGTSYSYFSMMVVGYMGKLKARFVLERSPFQVIPTPCRWTQNLTCKVGRVGSAVDDRLPLDLL